MNGCICLPTEIAKKTEKRLKMGMLMKGLDEKEKSDKFDALVHNRAQIC